MQGGARPAACVWAKAWRQDRAFGGPKTNPGAGEGVKRPAAPKKPGDAQDQHSRSGCGDGGTWYWAAGSPGGLSAGEDVSRLQGQEVLWCLGLRQGRAGEQDWLLKLFILK